MATIINIADTSRSSSLKPGLPGDIARLDLNEVGESILDTVAGAIRLPLPNAAAIVLAFDALRAVAEAHGLDATALWIGSDPQPEI
jgi:hypothetical protein